MFLNKLEQKWLVGFLIPLKVLLFFMGRFMAGLFVYFYENLWLKKNGNSLGAKGWANMVSVFFDKQWSND